MERGKISKNKADNGLRHQLYAELNWHHNMGAYNVSMDAERLVAVYCWRLLNQIDNGMNIKLNLLLYILE